jgi:hypothetical protein
MPPFSFPLPALGAALGAQNRARSEERLRREDEVRQSLRKTLQNLEEPLNHSSAPSQTMTEQHPISVPQELVQEWASESLATQSLCNRAAQWGADQELEACCEWLPSDLTIDGQDLRSVRRPEPLSLKEEALEALAHLALGPDPKAFHADMDTIRKALEQLND